MFRLEARLDSQEDLASTIEFLMSVEVVGTELAAMRRTPAELEEIRGHLEALEEAIRTNGSGIDDDMHFHQSIMRATHNEHFLDFSNFLETRVRRLIRAARTNTARHAGWVRQAQDEHRTIFEAIERQDPEAARHAARQHLINAAKRLQAR